MPEFRNKVVFEDVYGIRSTPKALLCNINGKDVWIPQSQIDDDSEVWNEGDQGKLIISDWIAIQKGLI